MTSGLAPDPERAAALDEFIRTHPDPFDWMRTHRLTQPGDPDRRVTRLPVLHHRWREHRHLAVDGEEIPGPATPR